MLHIMKTAVAVLQQDVATDRLIEDYYIIQLEKTNIGHGGDHRYQYQGHI